MVHTHRKIWGNFSKYSLGVGVGVIAFAMMFFSASFVRADDDVSENVGVRARVSESVSVAVSSNNAAFDIVPTASGTFGKTTVDVLAGTNAYYYKLYFADKDADTGLAYLTDNTLALPSVVASVTEVDFPVNRWGYSLDGASYAAIPAASSPVLLEGGESGAPREPEKKTITFGAKVNTAVPAGIYADTVTFTAFGYSEPRFEMVVSPALVEGAKTGTTQITLTLPLITVRPGEWSVTVASRECANVAVGEVENYVVLTCDAPNDIVTGTYEVVASSNVYGDFEGEIEYEYAPENFFTVEYMQDMTHEMCAEVPTPNGTTTSVSMSETEIYALTPDANGKISKIAQAYLKDQRGTKVSYVIRKLADGNCWMAQNLYLPGGTPINPSDSNVKTAWQLPASTSWSNNNTAAVMNNGSYTDNTTSSYGSYYNWCSATANTCNTATTAGDQTDEDICPRNWRLPINGEYGALYTAYSSNKSYFDSARATNYAGYSVSGDVGSRGDWWSSTASSGTGAYTLYESTSGLIYPAYSNARLSGFSVRCLAK